MNFSIEIANLTFVGGVNSLNIFRNQFIYFNSLNFFYFFLHIKNTRIKTYVGTKVGQIIINRMPDLD